MTYTPPSKCTRCVPVEKETTAGGMGRVIVELSHQSDCENTMRKEPK